MKVKTTGMHYDSLWKLATELICTDDGASDSTSILVLSVSVGAAIGENGGDSGFKAE